MKKQWIGFMIAGMLVAKQYQQMLMLRIVTITGLILQITQNLMIPITRQNITVITAMQKKQKKRSIPGFTKRF